MKPDEMAPAEPVPSVPEFALQLIRQLYHDLDDTLFEHGAVTSNALGVVAQAAVRGQLRGAVLLLLIQAAQRAYEILVPDHEPVADADETSSSSTLARLAPLAAAQQPALRSGAERVERYLAIAEARRQPVVETLAGLVSDFYRAIGDGDDQNGQRRLVELRSLLVHLDAAAHALEVFPGATEPVAVQRPDRFHDLFQRYAELAQKPAQANGERPLATLTRDGRLEAVIVADVHPLDAAADAVRQQMGETGAAPVLARIQALLAYLDGLRREPKPAAIGDAGRDPAVHLSLVIAAATAPLFASRPFDEDALGQIARFNQALLRESLPARAGRH